MVDCAQYTHIYNTQEGMQGRGIVCRVTTSLQKEGNLHLGLRKRRVRERR